MKVNLCGLNDVLIGVIVDELYVDVEYVIVGVGKGFGLF